jgi:hypothetical protein
MGNLILLVLFFTIIFLIGYEFGIEPNLRYPLVALLALVYFGLLISIFSDTICHPSDEVKNLCEENSISYTFVQTVAEGTGEDEKDVYTVCKYAAAADMDLYELVLFIDPDLTEDEAKAIVTLSDLKQKSME